LAKRAATSNGEPLETEAAERIVANVWLNRDAHRSCILGRVPLPTAAAETGLD